MRFNIDGTEYHLNLKKVTDDLKMIYDVHIVQGLPFPNGFKINIDKKSLPVLGLKQAITMLVIPVLTDLYKLKGYEIEAKKKHADVLDYFVRNILDLVGLIEHEYRFIVTTELKEDGIRSVKTIVRDTNKNKIPEYAESDMNDNSLEIE